MVQLHVQTLHSQVQQPPQYHNQSSKGKMDKLVLKSGIDEAEWSNWVYDWENYKVSVQFTSAQLYACMENDLKNDVQKCNPEVNARNMT